MTADESRAAWRRAKTFAEVCELGAGFVEGGLSFFPGWGAPDLDEESDAIANELAELNRGGFLTVASQPGLALTPAHDGQPREQRAFVLGFASPAGAERLVQVGDDGLVVRAWDARAAGGEAVPVARRGGEPYLFAGAAAGREELDLFADHVSEAALLALGGARFVSAVDLVWGRGDRLFEALVASLKAGF